MSYNKQASITSSAPYPAIVKLDSLHIGRVENDIGSTSWASIVGSTEESSNISIAAIIGKTSNVLCYYLLDEVNDGG